MKIYPAVLFFIFFIFSCKKTEVEKEVEKEDNDHPVLGTCIEPPASELQTNIYKLEEDNYVYRSPDTEIEIHFNFKSSLMVTWIEMILGWENRAFTYEFWGDGLDENGVENKHSVIYEKINGRHIKERLGNSRTLISPQGVKMTLVSEGPQSPVTSFTIYEGASVTHFNLVCKKIEYGVENRVEAEWLDGQQSDGETTTYDLNDTELTFYNIYNEESPGKKNEEIILLARLEKDNPKHLDNLYEKNN